MRLHRHKLGIRVIGTLLSAPAMGVAAWAQDATDAGFSIPDLSGGTQNLPLDIVILLTLLTFLPSILVSLTPFTRFLVIFHFLRQALSTQSSPSNQTLIGLALFLTYFVMQPVGAEIHDRALAPWQAGEINGMTAIELGSAPLREFMLRHTRETDLALFVEMAALPQPEGPEDLPMRVVTPAYILSELKTGFQIGVVLFLPFLVIDMVVASVTTSVGMLQLPPVMLSTPLKILLFVVVDGWNLVIGSMLRGLN